MLLIFFRDINKYMTRVKFILVIMVMFVIGGIVASFIYYQHLSINTDSSVDVRTSIVSTDKVTKFSIDNSPEQSLKGFIVQKSGDVLWQSRTATDSVEMKNIEYVQQGEVIKTEENSDIRIGFGDGTTLTILPLSELNIIQTLPYNLVFQQSKGKIEYQTVGLSPISIRTFRLITKLEQGHVLLSVDEENNITVSVLSGNVLVAYNSIDFISQVIPLNVGQTFLFNNDKREGTIE